MPGNVGRIAELVALPVADEVIVPGDDLAGGVQAGLEVMEAARTVEIVRHVVFASPQELDRHADGLGDPGGFGHVVVGEAPAETAAGAHLVLDDVAFGDAQGASHELRGRCRGSATATRFRTCRP